MNFGLSILTKFLPVQTSCLHLFLRLLCKLAKCIARTTRSNHRKTAYLLLLEKFFAGSCQERKEEDEKGMAKLLVTPYYTEGPSLLMTPFCVWFKRPHLYQQNNRTLEDFFYTSEQHSEPKKQRKERKNYWRLLWWKFHSDLSILKEDIELRVRCSVLVFSYKYTCRETLFVTSVVL